MAGNAVKVLDKPDGSALGEMVNAELSNQIATAKKYPRDEEGALDQLEKLATRSDAIAELCMYTLKRTQKSKDGGKDEIVYITGPSIRFMELLAYCWGNMRIGARIVEEGEKTVTAQGLAYDLQRNNGLMVEIKRGITTSKGFRFGQDMINVTSNAACSIAERNAIEDCIPRVLWWDIYEAVKHRAVGAAKIPERIQQAVKFFVGQGAKVEDIISAMGVGAIEDMGREHLEIFIGLKTAMKDGSAVASKIFTAEGEEMRARLSLSGDDDPANPGAPGTPIDRVMEKAKEEREAKADTGKKGGSPRKAAPKVKGDGGVSAAEETPADRKDDSPPADAAGSSQAGTDAEAETDSEADREDAQLVADVEAKLDPAKAMSSRKTVNEHRGALQRIAAMGEDDVKARAAKILTDWPPK
jgi:hypothetical protein